MNINSTVGLVINLKRFVFVFLWTWALHLIFILPILQHYSYFLCLFYLQFTACCVSFSVKTISEIWNHYKVKKTSELTAELKGQKLKRNYSWCMFFSLSLERQKTGIKKKGWKTLQFIINNTLCASLINQYFNK